MLTTPAPRRTRPVRHCPAASGSGSSPDPEAPPIDYYARGTGMARQFLAAQLAAGRTAGQIAATHDYITGPWRAADHHKPGQAETYRGYADHIGQQLMQLRAAEAIPQTTPQLDKEAGQ